MDPLSTRPKTVALVALGPSKSDYLHAVCCKKDFLVPDEVWLVNSLAGAINADKIFIMDDLKENSQRYPEWGMKLRHIDTPIVTCRKYDEWPSAVEYPIKAVCDTFQDDWFSNTVAYAIAYAALTEVEDLYLFGADFFYPNSNAIEPGVDCCAYWLGRARERGMRYRIPASSTLLDSHTSKVTDNKLVRPMYGYDYNPGRLREKEARGRATPAEQQLAAKAPTTIEKPKIAQGEKDG